MTVDVDGRLGGSRQGVAVGGGGGLVGGGGGWCFGVDALVRMRVVVMDDCEC